MTKKKSVVNKLTIEEVTKQYNQERKNQGKEPVANNHFGSLDNACKALNALRMTVPTPEECKLLRKESVMALAKTKGTTGAKKVATKKKVATSKKKVASKKKASPSKNIRLKVKVGKTTYNSLKKALTELKIKFTTGEYFKIKKELNEKKKATFNKKTFIGVTE